MSESKCTPGPWVCRPFGRGVDICAGVGVDLRVVAECKASSGSELPWCEADARLIAAAPDLLAACRAVAQQLTDMHAAIRDQGIECRFIDDSIDMISEGRTAIDLARLALARAEGGAG